MTKVKLRVIYMLIVNGLWRFIKCKIKRSNLKSRFDECVNETVVAALFIDIR